MSDDITNEAFEKWWDKLSKHSSLAAWMIKAVLPKGVAWQIWNDVPIYEDINKLKKENERLEKIIDDAEKLGCM